MIYRPPTFCEYCGNEVENIETHYATCSEKTRLDDDAAHDELCKSIAVTLTDLSSAELALKIAEYLIHLGVQDPLW